MKTRLILALLAAALPVAAGPKTAHIGNVGGQHPGTQFVIGGTFYDSPDIHGEVAVGSDYPARVSGKTVRLRVGGRTYSYAISESARIEPQPATVPTPENSR